MNWKNGNTAARSFHQFERVRDVLLQHCAEWSLSRGSGQSFPAKPIRLPTGFAPGGGADVAARVLTQHWPEKSGQPVVIDRR
jgi:tripartite-type tricarboxylate transporter receptor subunit TctC